MCCVVVALPLRCGCVVNTTQPQHNHNTLWCETVVVVLQLFGGKFAYTGQRMKATNINIINVHVKTIHFWWRKFSGFFCWRPEFLTAVVFRNYGHGALPYGEKKLWGYKSMVRSLLDYCLYWYLVKRRDQGTRESSEKGNQDYSWYKTFAIQGASYGM